MTTKTRFAPSPTGQPHIGHLRTAIYAWLTAKKDNWTFFMRLEDTDQTRFVPWTADILIKVINWIWITVDEGFMWENVLEKWDFGPYVQSQRKDLYKKYALELVEKDAAYFCFCPKIDREDEDIDPKLVDIHDSNCRNLTKEEIEAKINNWESFTIKHKVPLNSRVIINDIIHWEKAIDTNTIDDSVLLKSDWHATYHLAHLVDDYLMQTTHVIRTEEWLPSLPKHTLLFNQMWWTSPKYAHPSLIMILDKETGNKRKFSKRKKDPNVLDLIACGYLNEALFNYVAFLGWNPWAWETREIYSIDEFKQIFSLEKCHKAGAMFDTDKLNWMNSEYIKVMDIDKLYDKLETYLKDFRLDFYNNVFVKFPKEYNEKILKELQTKIKKFDEYEELTTFFYKDANINLDLLLNEKMWINSFEIAKKSLQLALEILNSNNFDTIDDLKNIFIEKIKELWFKNWQVLWPIRASLSWEQFSPGAFELIMIFGKQKSIERITKYLEKL